ncbi:hypothetical protein Emed_002229 [Eimeria media]
MAADSSLLKLEECGDDTAVSPAAAAAAHACRLNATSDLNSNSSNSSSNCSSSNCSSSSSNSNSSSCSRRDGGSSVSTQNAARQAALKAAAQAASLSERCRSLLPLLKESAARPSVASEEADAQESRTVPVSKSSSNSSNNNSSSSNSSSVVTKEVTGPQTAEFLELESDGEGPMIELEVGVGVMDVKGQVPDDARLAELGVQVVDLPEDSPVLQNTSSQLDAVQRALAARGLSSCEGERPLVSVLSSGSSSEDEGDSGAVSPED